ncbi:MAG: CRISPR-associated protein Cas4 [Agathobacter sp.]|nr:CRISPR-associated protein Cas4 [Agathobacter sp.]
MEEKIKITGLMVYYYWVCRRKLWYYSHDISMEHNSEDVKLGKLLDENSFKREDKHININNEINIDFINESRIVHEIKKSRKIEDASVWQLKYYLYYLNEAGVTGVEGKIDYPTLKKSIKVTLSDDDCKVINNVIKEIIEIVEKPIPTEFNKKRICEKCAYYEMCAI